MEEPSGLPFKGQRKSPSTASFPQLPRELARTNHQSLKPFSCEPPDSFEGAPESFWASVRMLHQNV